MRNPKNGYYDMRIRTISTIIVIMALISIVGAGCRATRKSGMPIEQSGFLCDYSLLSETDSAISGDCGPRPRLRYINPDADWAGHKKVLVDSGGDVTLLVKNNGADGAVVGKITVKAPKLTKRKISITNQNSVSDDGVELVSGQIVGAEGGVVVPAMGFVGPLDGSAIDVPAGALTQPTAIFIGTSPEIELEEVETALGESPRKTSESMPNTGFDLPLKEARERFERSYLEHQLRLTGGNMSRLAERVGLERTHLYRKLRALGIDSKQVVGTDS